LGDFQPVTGVFHEYRRAGTFFAWSVAPETPNVNEGTAWSPEQEWYVHTSRNGESLRKDDEGHELTLKDTLFQEAFAPAFADCPFAHELINEVVRIVRTKEPEALLQTVGFRGANTLYVLKTGEVALVAGGQFKVGRMGSNDGGTKHSGRKQKDKIRRNSFMPTEMRLTDKAYMCGEIIGPFAAPQDIVTVTELASELFVITTDVLQEFSDNALESMAALTAEQNTLAMNGLEERPAEKLDRVCRDFFQMCDDDHSGSISPMEFSRVMRKQAKKFGPQFKDWFNRPLLIFEQIDEDGDGNNNNKSLMLKIYVATTTETMLFSNPGTIDEEEFVKYATERGDAMMLGLIMGATAHTESSSANNVELAQREATDALVESLRARLTQMEEDMANQLKSMKEEKINLFNVVANACFSEMKD
jgi:Ca2+-binding EF-hand superfamily protein